MTTTLVSALASLPFYAMWAVGIVVAVARWSRHPTVSALVVTSAVLQLVASLARFLIPTATERLGWDHTMLTLMFAMMGFISTVGLGCLLVAVFAERDSRTGPPPG